MAVASVAVVPAALAVHLRFLAVAGASVAAMAVAAVVPCDCRFPCVLAGFHVAGRTFTPPVNLIYGLEILGIPNKS